MSNYSLHHLWCNQLGFSALALFLTDCLNAFASWMLGLKTFSLKWSDHKQRSGNIMSRPKIGHSVLSVCSCGRGWRTCRRLLWSQWWTLSLWMLFRSWSDCFSSSRAALWMPYSMSSKKERSSFSICGEVYSTLLLYSIPS